MRTPLRLIPLSACIWSHLLAFYWSTVGPCFPLAEKKVAYFTPPLLIIGISMTSAASQSTFVIQ